MGQNPSAGILRGLKFNVSDTEIPSRLRLVLQDLTYRHHAGLRRGPRGSLLLGKTCLRPAACCGQLGRRSVRCWAAEIVRLCVCCRLRPVDNFFFVVGGNFRRLRHVGAYAPPIGQLCKMWRESGLMLQRQLGNWVGPSPRNPGEPRVTSAFRRTGAP